jgi:hypothetical protein
MDRHSLPSDKPDLATVQERADDAYTLFVCLKNAGFDEMQALHLMQPMLIIGTVWKREL